MSRPRSKRSAEPSRVEPPSPAGRVTFSRRRKVLYSLLIVLLWGALFAALEVGLRAGGYGRDYSLFLEIDEEIRIDNPEYTRRFFPAGDLPGVAETSNLFSTAKDPSILRVFVVGESTAQGFPYQRGHSFSRIAGEALAAQGIEVEIINVGNSAMSSYYLRETLGEIERYDPDLVVVYAGHNEYYGTPSSFTGGTHFTRLAVLKLRKLRSFQLFESIVVRVSGREPADGANLMEERFAELLYPSDEERDREVAELFVRNLRAGVQPLLRDDVPVLFLEPVSNLVSMPPFRSAPEGTNADRSAATRFSALRAELDEGAAWERSEWEAAKDLDEAPFRARSILVSSAEAYVSGEPLLHWIPTSDEMEMRAGYRAFTDDYFIDHLHLNFEGQSLIASILAEAMAEVLFPERPELRTRLSDFFANPRQVRESVHLTDYWEFDAYSLAVALLEQEPFRSMPIPKANPLTPERILANPLYADPNLLDLFRGLLPGENIFHAALEYYYLSGQRDEWIRNMNAYVYLFPGRFSAHMAYGIGLLADDSEANLNMAASYLRQAFVLSGRSEEIRDALRSEFFRMGIESAWPAFEIQYLR